LNEIFVIYGVSVDLSRVSITRVTFLDITLKTDNNTLTWKKTLNFAKISKNLTKYR